MMPMPRPISMSTPPPVVREDGLRVTVAANPFVRPITASRVRPRHARIAA
jgi:hypothetical protein